MAAEMGEQPAVIAGLLDRADEVRRAVRSVAPPELAGVLLVARGSSDHAAVYARYLLEVATRRPVALAAPSLLTHYGLRPDYRGYLAVAVSQSGRTPEVVTVLERAAAAGARTLAVTNDPRSPLARAAHASVDLGAGREAALPATKTFTAQLVALALVTEAVGVPPWRRGDWEGVPDAVRWVLDRWDEAREATRTLTGAAGLVCVARGYLYAVALEAALKLKETTFVLADGYSSADLRHGPVAVAERGFPFLAFSVAGPVAADVGELVASLRARGARVLTCSDDPHSDLPLPPGLPEPLAAVPATVRAQQVAHSLALLLGLDPDRPPGLRKVTRT
ncbi:MAG TPA: SIS domain-containing protein [Actinomycetota bacterium]|nr:SIS domain-containing protein [Actinomycetota bacterium]